MDIEEEFYHITNNTTILVYFTGNGSDIDKGAEISLWRSIIVGVVLGSIILIAVFGNILVVMAIFTNRRLRTVTNYFVVSLAISDLLVAILVMPFHIVIELTGRWWFGYVICDIWISFDVMLCTASILNLCCISVDRYFAITRPLIYATKRSKKLALIMIAIVWVASSIITCPPIFGWAEEGRWDTNDHVCYLTRDPGYIIYSSLGSFYIPLVVMLFVYANIFKVAREREIRLKPYRRSIMRSSRYTCNETNVDELSLSETRGSDDTSGEKQDGNQISDGSNQSDSTDRTQSTPAHVALTGILKMPLSENCASKNTLSRSRALNESANRIHYANYQSFKCKNDLITYTHHKNNQVVTIAAKNGRSPTLKQTDRNANTNSKKFRACFAKERKAAKTLAVVVGVFILCWLPFFLVYVIEPFCKSCYVHPILLGFVTWLGYVNSCMNPFIYAFSNRDFRHSFWKLTFGKCQKTKPKEVR
ncbi:putative G-protein coupled receptor No18 [Tubulanus polymorphus]|uniref:putative G-protein coupled receptor No18 n=1 Tax=Tubulanus polymorphus TaxID=672921 RepID=UPI003DA5477D